MKKMILCTAVLFVFGIGIKAEDLTTKSGKTYKDVKYFLINPTGIDISYKKDNQTFLTHVLFKDLSEKIQKRFHYSPEKAKVYQEKLTKIHEDALKRHEKRLKEQKDKKSKDLALESRIEAGAINVVLQEYATKGDGTIAYASSPGCTVTTGHMGKVFVAGLMGMSGEEDAHVIYPTGKNKFGYPCYAATLDRAIEIAQE